MLGLVCLGVLSLLPPVGGLEGQAAEEAKADYWVWVGSESDDLIHRIRFGPDGATVESQMWIGRNPGKVEGPHGLAISPDGRYMYMTTGHGAPDGFLWKFELGPDTLVAGPTPLGRFPASLDVTPDGLLVFVANFNLHGEHVPSSMSAAYAPDLYEIEQIEVCVMPHGSRVHPQGHRVYTVCMMDEQLVEIDVRRFEVSRRFSLVEGEEGPLMVTDSYAEAHGHGHHGADPVALHGGMGHGEVGGHDHLGCSPTWVSPDPEGRHLYVVCNRGRRVVEIDTEDWSIVRTFPTGEGPYNVEVTPDGRLLVVTLKQGNAVEFIDLLAGETVARTATSTSVVHGVAISPDSRYAFVSVEGVGQEPGKVDVFDLGTFARVADVEVGRQASGIAFWQMQDR